MKRPNLSVKRVAIDKTNSSLIIIIGVTVFVVIFSIVAINSLYNQLTYQNKVIGVKKTTLKQVDKNIEEAQKLDTAYKEFAGSVENIIGGNINGTGDRDGANARIILDALPSRYDFPALTTSLDKLAKSGGFQLSSINGTDDEVNQAANESAVTPQPIQMPFSVEAEVAPTDGKRFLELFERSIRPIQLKTLNISGQDNALRITISADTYFQPEKKLNVTEEVVK